MEKKISVVIIFACPIFISSIISHVHCRHVRYLENVVPCLNKSIHYRQRPTSVVDVAGQMSIISFHAFSAIRMDFAADIYLMQSWLDRRCMFRPIPGQGAVLTLYSTEAGKMSHVGLNNLWQPDTHILNAKNSHRPEIVTKIKHMGFVATRTRMASIVSCPMDLRLFPMDRQMCSLVIQSSAHTNQELKYHWKYGNKSKLTFIQGLELQDRVTPDIRIIGYRFRTGSSQPNEDVNAFFDQIIVDIFLERPLGYFLWEVYMPATFIVIISFSSFWLARSATPARVSLGVTTVLTITTLLSSANINLPPTAYPKAIGIFLAGCFVFTFLAFLEYSAASYLEEFRTNFHRRQQSTDTNEQGSDPPSSSRRIRKFTLADIRDPLGWKPSAVDTYSRIFFPVVFILFQGIYWSVLCLSQDSLPQDVVLIKRD